MSGDYISLQFPFPILILALCLEYFLPLVSTLHHRVWALHSMPVPWRRSAELAFLLCQQTTGSVHLALLHKQQVIWFMLHAHILLFGVAVRPKRPILSYCYRRLLAVYWESEKVELKFLSVGTKTYEPYYALCYSDRRHSCKVLQVCKSNLVAVLHEQRQLELL